MTTPQPANAAPTGALRDVRVLEFGHYIPGPMLGMLLADQGAHVVKVEPPWGDPARRYPAFATWNRGKRSVVLDLKSEEGRVRALELARWADVVIENFRPRVAQRLGIDYERLAAANPGLVYCSLPGFGEESPRRDARGWDPIVGAATGVHQAVEGTVEPLFTPLPAPSTFGAIVGAVSVASALVFRQRTGAGQRIEVPLHNAMFSAIGRHMVRLRDTDPPDLFTLPRAIMNHQYQCADGRWVQHHGMFERFVRRFLDVAGHPEWTEDAVVCIGREVDQETVDTWLRRFEGIFRQRTALEWEDAISAAGGACTVCKPVEEWLAHEHARASGMVAEVEDAKLGRMLQPGVQVKLRGTPGAIQGRAPLLGEHTESALSHLEHRRDGPAAAGGEAATLSQALGALQGVRVLDLCLILAGPTCGRTLGEFGADVIKIDDPGRPYDPVGSLDVNRGKRSMLLDLKSAEGLEVFWKLVDTADVVVENNRKGSMARLGLGYPEVSKRKPDIVYASMNTYGYDGPWSERPGWEQLAQGTTGIQVRRGGRNGRPMTLTYAMNDYGTGMLGAFAVALALLERGRTGRGQSVDTALAFTAGLLQSPFYLEYEGMVREEPEGLEARGFSALSRLYQASDGWLYLHCPDEAGWKGMAALEDFSRVSSDARFATAQGRASADGELAGAMAEALRRRTRQEWIDTLEPLGVSVIENLAPEEFRDDPDVRRAGLVVTRDHAGRGMVDHPAPTARLSRTPPRIGRPSPLLGAETREILSELGYPEQEIARLEAQQVVVQA